MRLLVAGWVHLNDFSFVDGTRPMEDLLGDLCCLLVFFAAGWVHLNDLFVYRWDSAHGRSSRKFMLLVGRGIYSSMISYCLPRPILYDDISFRTRLRAFGLGFMYNTSLNLLPSH